MSPAQQVLNYRREIDENQKQIREIHELDEDEELAGYGIRKTYYKNIKSIS